jgi:hypothetical protein
MANFFNSFLQGALGAGNQFKDFQHATRLYVDNRYALAPKEGFLYYVKFSINQAAIPNNQWAQTSQREIGMLVKGCDLPKFTIGHEVLNQYNRKTYIQNKITYSTVSFTFHDDHSNTTHNLWKSYYAYYYADGKTGATNSTQRTSGGPGPSANQFTVPPAFGDTKYQNGSNPFQTTSYGLNNGQNKPYFNYIIVYQLNRKQYTSYLLVNPIITEWAHDKLEQSSNAKMLENRMTIGYEAVLYSEGKVTQGSPAGEFSTVHYDLSPSPLSVLGGGSASLFGPGGTIDGINEVFGDLQQYQSGNGSPSDLFKAAIGSANILRNAGNITGAGAASEGLALLTGGIASLGGSRGNLPTSVSAGAGSVAGFAVNLFKGKSTSAPADASQAQVTDQQQSQVAQGDLPGPSTAAAPSGPTLPSPLPTDADSLNTVLADQQAAESSLLDQITKNTDLKAKYDSIIATAKASGNPLALNAVYAKMAAQNYTDPVKLTASLTQVQNNISQVQSALQTAQATETPPDTLSADQKVAGTAPESNLDSSENTDYNINTNDIKIADNNDSTPKEDYQSA